MVHRIDGVNDCHHAFNRYHFEFLELCLKLFSLLQSKFVFPVLDYLPVESKSDFILIEILDQGKVFVADLVFDEPSLLILHHMLLYGLHQLAGILLIFGRLNQFLQLVEMQMLVLQLPQVVVPPQSSNL